MSGGKPATRVLFALALVTACTLGYQVTFTRLLSAVVAYHFSFLAVSLGMLGVSAGALVTYVRPAWFDRRPLESSLAWWSAVYGLLLVASPLALVRLDYSIHYDVSLSSTLHLGAVCLIAAASSFAAGVVVALAIRGYRGSIARVYAWDLVGAGVGAVAIVPLLHLAAPVVIVGLGVVAGLASVLFAGPHLVPRRAGGVVAGMGALLVVAASLTSVLYLPMGYEGFGEPEGDRWHPLSRVQGYDVEEDDLGLLFYDRVYAPLVPVRDGGDLPDWAVLGLGPASIAYEVTGPGETLIIGGGGGRDIYNALTSDQQVDVIELNSAIRDVVDDDMAEVSGSPYSRDGVSTSIGDGRAVLAGRDRLYDSIHIGFTDTLSANAAAGFALTENNLYTVEAFEEYLDHLTPDGILTVSRLERLVGDEAIRVTVLALAALERQGVEDPERHVVVLRATDYGTPYGSTLVRKEPFTDAELEQIRELAAERADRVSFAPGGPYYGAWADLAEAPGWRSFCEGYALDICPPTDDRPFFFNMRRLGDVFGSQGDYVYQRDPVQVLLLTVAVLLALSVAAFLVPLRLAPAGSRPPIPSLLYFAALGMGFMILETVLIQRFVLFLGFPTYALSVVLCGLLIFTGIGSALSGRLQPTRRTLTVVLGVAVAILGASAFTLQPLVRALIDQPFVLRVVVTVLILVPIGLVLGMPMPLGLSRFSARHPTSVAYAWGVNGITSVLASAVGVAVALYYGYRVASLVAVACYAVALLQAVSDRRAPTDPTPPAEPDVESVVVAAVAADEAQEDLAHQTT